MQEIYLIMWEDLSFKQRMELEKLYREYGIDTTSQMKELYNSMQNQYADGGDTNNMEYEHIGTMYSDRLKDEGITHIGYIPEVKVSAQKPAWMREYRSANDPLAAYKYGVEPILQAAGWTFDQALKPMDTAVEVATSPAWWINKAITGNSDNTVQKTRDWAHQAMRDAGMLFSPTRVLGTVASGFEYAPWNTENPGVFGNDEMGQALNNTMDIVASPAVAKITGRGLSSGYDNTMARVRAAAYNNITPFAYGPDFNIGTFKINKSREIKDAAKDFFTPKRIDTSYPNWKRRYDEHIARTPEEADMANMYDYDVITAPAWMEFRDQAWAKAMRQPESDRWTANIYKDNGDGTVRYDLDAVDEIRKKYDSSEFSGAITEHRKGAKYGYEDNITTNGGGVNISTTPEGYYRMQDVWDIAPMQKYFDMWFPKDQMPSLVQKAMNTKKGQQAIKNIKNFDLVKFFGGDPFKLDMTWNPNDPRFFE